MKLLKSEIKESTAQVKNAQDEERLAVLQHPRWIGYPKANHILDKMDELLKFPPRHRMPNLLITGSTNNGKTMVVNRFKMKNPGGENATDGTVEMPVFMIQAPPVPDESRFYNIMLENLFSPYRQSDRPDKKQFQVISILRHLKTRMLIIDEIHHIIAGAQLKQRLFLNTIKYLCNELQITLVAIGTEDAHAALQSDPQLSNRFEPVSLPKWEIGTDYLRLLASYEKLLPLKKESNLTETDIALKILSMTDGLIGEIDTLLTKASIKAIVTRREKITNAILDELDWITPSKRKWNIL